MEDIHFGLRFRDMEAAMEKWRDQNPQADTVRTLLADLGKAETMVAARKVLLPEAFADGMGTAETLCETVKHDLLAAILDDRSHRAVGGDISFDLRKCLPRPFMQAVASLSEGNGLHDEAVAWCFYANIAFLEHHNSQGWSQSWRAYRSSEPSCFDWRPAKLSQDMFDFHDYRFHAAR